MLSNRIIIQILCVLGGLVAFSGCSEPASDLIYVIPNGYHGELSIILHDPQGQPSRPKGGVVFLDFTKSNRVSVSDADPLRNWCRQSARFGNGTPLKIFAASNRGEPDGVFLDHYVLPTDDAKLSYIFVGSYADVLAWREALLKRLASGKIKS